MRFLLPRMSRIDQGLRHDIAPSRPDSCNAIGIDQTHSAGPAYRLTVGAHIRAVGSVGKNTASGLGAAELQLVGD